MLLDAGYTARLADFGYASLVGNIPEALAYLQRSTARPGALRWISPEQIKSEETFDRTPKNDIYSFGCVALQESSSNSSAGPILIFSQVLSGKQPWSEVREDVAVVRHLVQGHKPGRPVSRVIDDSHWNLIQDCWSSVDERPAAAVIISTIQRFLNHCPQSPLLCDLLGSSSTHADSLVDEFSSLLSRATTEDSGRNLELPDRDKRYKLHGYVSSSNHVDGLDIVSPSRPYHALHEGRVLCDPVVSTCIEHEHRLVEPSPLALSNRLSNIPGFPAGMGLLSTFEGKFFPTSTPTVPSN